MCQCRFNFFRGRDNRCIDFVLIGFCGFCNLWKIPQIREGTDGNIKCSITDFSIPDTIFDQGEGIAADCHKLAVCLVNLWNFTVCDGVWKFLFVVSCQGKAIIQYLFITGSIEGNRDHRIKMKSRFGYFPGIGRAATKKWCNKAKKRCGQQNVSDVFLVFHKNPLRKILYRLIYSILWQAASFVVFFRKIW